MESLTHVEGGVSTVYPKEADIAVKTSWLKGFNDKYEDTFELTAMIGAAVKEAILESLVEEFGNHLIKVDSDCEKGVTERHCFLEYLLISLRLCMRESVGLGPAVNISFVVNLKTCVAPKLSAKRKNVSNKECLLAAKCLLNFLHLSDTAADIFLQQSENSSLGFQWLGEQLWHGGCPNVQLYVVRTIYMLLSTRKNLIEASFEKHNDCGGTSIYCMLVSAAIGTCYRRGTSSASNLIVLHEFDRSSLFQELSKVIYMLRDSSIFQCEDAAVLDFNIQVTAMHIILCPNFSDNIPMNNNLFACKASALQLLMVVASTDSGLFREALYFLARRTSVGVLTVNVTYDTLVLTDAEVTSQRTVLVPSLLVPFLRSLLDVFEIQLMEVESSLTGGLATMVSTAQGTKLIPILTTLSALAEHGDEHLRRILLQLLVGSMEYNQENGTERNIRSQQLTSKYVVHPFSLFNKLLQLMTSLESYSKRYASEFLFSLCGKNADAFVKLTGFGNAVSLLRTKGLLGM